MILINIIMSDLSILSNLSNLSNLISNKHLNKIIIDYIDIKVPYIRELLEKTYLILSCTNIWYSYNNYIKCSEDCLMIHKYKRNQVIDDYISVYKYSKINKKWFIWDKLS